MQVILIGSGNIAGLMGPLLLKNGHSIRQVFSRSMEHAKNLAAKLNAEPIADLAAISAGADIYIVSVSDDALPIIAAGLKLTGELVIHTSGTSSREILSECSKSYGVLWPIKMVRQATLSFTPATIVIDANKPALLQRVEELARQFSENVVIAGDAERSRMHMVATFTTNFSNHLFDLAAGYCQRENISFNHFYPLIEAAIQQLRDHHPHSLQAGPAFRHDHQTIQKHRELLQNDSQMKKIYDMMTESIFLSFSK